MKKEQKDPEVVLQDIIDDLIDNSNYKNYEKQADLLQFFKGMKTLVDQICKNVNLLELDLKDKSKQIELLKVEKEEFSGDYNTVNEKY